MSTVRTHRAPRVRPAESDPFFYGWRYVEVLRPDGTEDLDQVPLTLEDVLHPKEGDHIVNSQEHADDVIYLRDVSGAQLIDDPHAAVLCDVGVDFNLPRIRPLCPDLAVFFGIARRRGWSIFDVKAERAKCALVIEVTSDSTRQNDFGRKFKYYYRAGVAMYVIVNEFKENKTHRRLELIGYRYAPGRYEKIPLSADGRIWLEALGVWLGVSPQSVTGGDRVACFDPATNEEIADYAAITKARNLAEAKAAQAQQIAAKAQQKAAKAQQKAAKAHRIAAKAQQTAKAEAQARKAAETRIRELEALLKRSAPKS
jgi:colicin import membrane protein